MNELIECAQDWAGFFFWLSVAAGIEGIVCFVRAMNEMAEL